MKELKNYTLNELREKEIVRIRGYVKVIDSKRGKFSVMEAKLNNTYFRIKFTRKSGFTLPLTKGYYLIHANVSDVSKSVEKVEKDGKEYITNVLWVNTLLDFSEDIETKEAIDKARKAELFSLTENMPF